MRRNFAVQLSSKTVTIAVSLATTPFSVARLGLATFGFWALISAFSQYAALLDFGVGSGLARFIAADDVMEDYATIAARVVAATATSIVFAVAIVLVTATAAVAIPATTSHGWPAGWQWTLIGVGLNLGCFSVASAFQAIPAGFGRWDLQNAPIIVYQIVYAAVAVGALADGRGIAGLGLAVAVGGAVMLCTSIWAARRLWSQQWSVRLFRMAHLRELLHYSANLQVSNLVQVVNLQSDKPVILAFGGSLRFVGFYELAARIAFQLRSLPVSALGPLTMEAATVAARGGLGAVARFYEDSFRGAVVLIVAPLLAIYGCAYPLTLAWLGRGYGTTGTILLALGCGYGINLLTGTGTALANGCGRPQLDRDYSLLGLCLNIILTVAFGFAYGPWGVVGATVFGLTVSGFWLLHRVDRWLGTALFTLRDLRAKGAFAFVMGVAIGAGLVVATLALPSPSRLSCLGLGLIGSALTALLWAAVIPEARSLVRSLLARVFGHPNAAR